jgi:hypothetical protein
MAGVLGPCSRRLLRMAWGASCSTFFACSAGDRTVSVPDSSSSLLEAEEHVCPQITGFSVAPLTASLGGHIAVSSVADDLGEGNELKFFWLASAGDFEDATASATRYTCTQAGNYLLQLVVSDGKCGDQRWLPIQCISSLGSGSKP